MLLPFLTVFDFATIRANFAKPINLAKIKTREDDFALLVPIFNDTKYLTNITFMKKYGSKVVLCTTTNETKEFLKELRILAKKYKFRIRQCDMGGNTKNPWAIYNKTLLAHDAVLKSTIGQLKEKYVIFIDGDTFVDGELDHLTGAMKEKDFDLASVKVLPTKRETVMEKLQGVEYDIAMQARLIYPWLTSGAGMIAKREVMVEIMKNHSLFFNGGDIEIGRLADMMGYKVGHLPMVFYTDIPPTFRSWAKQRFSWMCGMFRHSIINVDHNMKHPFHFIYFTFIIYFLMPFKVIEMARHPYLLPYILVLYVVITYFANWKVRSRWMLLFPFYALFQVLVLVWCGIYRYFRTVVKSGNFGKIRLLYRPLHMPVVHLPRLYNTSKNLAIIISVVLFISLTSVNPIQRIFFGRDYHPMELMYASVVNVYNFISSQGNDVKLASWTQEPDTAVLGATYEYKKE